MRTKARHDLERWMQEHGVTQEQLAEKAGTQQPRISAFLGGECGFGPELAGRISEITGIALETLLLKRPKPATPAARRSS